MKVVLCGYYGFGNGGDEALLASLLQLLPAGVEPIVLSGNPTQTKKAYGVAAVNRWHALAVFGALQQSQALILGGGSLFQDVTSWRTVIYYGGLLGWAQQLGLETIAWAQGVGPLRSGWARFWVERVLRGCAQVSVRDRQSAELLTRWQIPYTQTVDPVWSLQAKPVVLPSQVPMPRVAVVLRPHRLLTAERITMLIEALRQFQQATEVHLLLVPFHLPEDVLLAETIQAALPQVSQVLTLRDPRQLKGVFRQVEWTLAMRFHGVLMAASEGCPVWGISYDPKVTQLLQEINAPGLELQDLPEQPTTLVQAWLEHYANGEGLNQTQRAWWLDRSAINGQVLKELIHD